MNEPVPIEPRGAAAAGEAVQNAAQAPEYNVLMAINHQMHEARLDAELRDLRSIHTLLTDAVNKSGGAQQGDRI